MTDAQSLQLARAPNPLGPAGTWPCFRGAAAPRLSILTLRPGQPASWLPYAGHNARQLSNRSCACLTLDDAGLRR